MSFVMIEQYQRSKWRDYGMSQNHYSTKPKRRQKNKKRKDYSASTMAKIREREAAEKKK